MKPLKTREDFLKAWKFVNDIPPPQTGDSTTVVIEAIRSKIRANWMVPPKVEIKSVSAFVMLDAQGRLDSAQIMRSSGDPVLDNSLLRAIRKSDPLPIPAAKLESFRNLELVFEAPQQ